MEDLFISPVESGLISWMQALPNAQVVQQLSSVKHRPESAILFWLHMNEDRQEWLSKTIVKILKEYKNAKIVVLANAPVHAEALQALRLGALGYCHAYSSAEVLKEVKAVIEHGGIWLGNELLRRLIDVTVNLVGNQPAQVDALLAQLTGRQQEVALEAAKGLSNKEIARVLNIAERTVKAHLAATFETLKVKDRLQLALMLNSRDQRA
jgi:two-component system nitrate/nitrite response regulator NarL